MALRTRNVLSLCAGVGGLELGISLALGLLGERARGVCYVEREAAAAASLVASMEAGWLHPAPVWSDLLTFDARAWRGLVHILASGDPCQDNSVAGKREGEDGERFLAPEVVRVAEECRPALIFRENVPGNADGQLAALIPALEGLGYRIAAGIFSSAETGNTMRRERLFIMALANSEERSSDFCQPNTGTDWWRHPEGRGAGMDGTSRGRHWHEVEEIRSGRNGVVDAGKSVGSPERSGDRRLPHDTGRGSIERTASDRAGNRSEREAALAGASSTRSQGDQFGTPLGGQHRVASPRPTSELRGALLPPAVIPGPSDSRWIDVLDRFPELQPALSKEEAESHLRRGIDAVAYRVERLRATGNGVDPVTAAYAFLCLRSRLSE